LTMSHKRNWDVEKIITDLQRIAADMNSWRNDGWTQWGAKQDLYRVKFEVDRLLKDSPYFSMEKEWLAEQEKQQVWKILNDKKL
jgi:hypothetical protein